jgi:hypothetical protein
MTRGWRADPLDRILAISLFIFALTFAWVYSALAYALPFENHRVQVITPTSQYWLNPEEDRNSEQCAAAAKEHLQMSKGPMQIFCVPNVEEREIL